MHELHHLIRIAREMIPCLLHWWVLIRWVEIAGRESSISFSPKRLIWQTLFIGVGKESKKPRGKVCFSRIWPALRALVLFSNFQTSRVFLWQIVEMDISTNQMPHAAFCLLCLTGEVAGGKYIGMGLEGDAWNRKTRMGERESRRRKVQVKEMEERLKRKTRLSASCQGPDVCTSQIELQEGNEGQCSLEAGSSLCPPADVRMEAAFIFTHLQSECLLLCYPIACSFSYWDIKWCCSCMSTLWQILHGHVRIWPVWQFQAFP